VTRHKPSKRDQILSAATERFGRDGYETTKWADIAADVGVGPTALYHYFESKQHCLYVILGQVIESFRTRFEKSTAGQPDPLAALLVVMEDCFDLAPQDIMRLRVMVAEQGRLSIQRTSPREEEAREAARARARALRLAWVTFLEHAMEHGSIPPDDPRLLARAILGLYNSIWEWYRPNGVVPLARVADFFIDRVLALVGLTPDAARELRMTA
jgi:TetR/AcrR family transcriptional regulator, cholesterol catabolism regulator